MQLEQQILSYAEQQAPREMCGFVVFKGQEKIFIPCENIAADPENYFEISAGDYLMAHEYDDIIALVHSHPNGEPVLSVADRQMQVQSDLDWWLVCDGEIKRFKNRPHLLGREFIHGSQDCYTLFRDAYMLAGLDLPEFDYAEEWYKQGENYYLEQLPKHGFSIIDKPKELKKLLSEQHSRTLFVFSEGECESVAADLTRLYLNDTPVKNADGSKNFELQDIEVQTRTGTKNQTVMAGYQNSEKEIPVGVELKHKKPVVRTVTDPNVKRVRITLGVKGLYHQFEGTGNTIEHYVVTWVSAGKQSQEMTFLGVSRDQYLQQVEFDVSSEKVPFNIKVERVTKDNTEMNKQNDTFWSSYTEIIPSNLNYPHTALLGLQLNSRTFGSFPRVNALMRGIKVHIPSNYNPYICGLI